jgi:translation initiation factor IF-2
MKDLTILLDLEVGRPAAMLAEAASQEVPILASCLFPRLGGRVAHATVRSEDLAAMKLIVKTHGGVIADERESVIIPADHPGGIEAVSQAIAAAGIMINVAYFGARGDLVLATPDVAAARKVIGLE